MGFKSDKQRRFLEASQSDKKKGMQPSMGNNSINSANAATPAPMSPQGYTAPKPFKTNNIGNMGSSIKSTMPYYNQPAIPQQQAMNPSPKFQKLRSKLKY